MLPTIFATQCSRPIATKAEMPLRQAMNFPPIVCAAVACHTARQTNLHQVKLERHFKSF